MDEQLQRLYSPSQWSDRMSADTIVDAHGAFLKEKSEEARRSLDTYTYRFNDAACDEDAEQCIDFYFARADPKQPPVDHRSSDSVVRRFEDKDVLVYIHGGYWQWGSVSASGFMAENFTARGIVLAALGHTLAPKATLSQIVAQVERGVAKVLELTAAASCRVYICGHSSGGHLAASVLQALDRLEAGDGPRRIRGIVCVSGVFELAPLLRTDINDMVRMDETEAHAQSPARSLTLPSRHSEPRVLLAYGAQDPPAFKEQSNGYAHHLRHVLQLREVTCIQVEHTDHFDIVEKLCDDNYELTKEIYKIMNVDDTKED